MLPVISTEHLLSEKIYREALDIQRRVMGLEHPDTLLSMDNLNNTLAEQGRYAEPESTVFPD